MPLAKFRVDSKQVRISFRYMPFHAAWLIRVHSRGHDGTPSILMAETIYTRNPFSALELVLEQALSCGTQGITCRTDLSDIHYLAV